jgi:hypothetical protein
VWRGFGWVAATAWFAGDWDGQLRTRPTTRRVLTVVDRRARRAADGIGTTLTVSVPSAEEGADFGLRAAGRSSAVIAHL